MLDRRASLIVVAAVPIGLVLGAAAWTLAGGAGLAQASVSEAAAQFPKSITRSTRDVIVPNRVTAAINAPLFLVAGAAGSDPVIRLEGIARSPGRVAALLVLDAKPSAWLSLGETRDGVTLIEVLGAKVTVDTPAGLKEIRLGEASGVSGGETAAASAPMVADRGASSGYRMPPAPASAPEMARP